MNKFALIILLALFSNGCENNLSEADKKRVTELNEKAVQSLMIDDFEEAKANYLKALEIDKSDSFIRYELIGIYVEQDSLDKAFATLNEVPSDQKKTTYYYQVKAELHEYKGQVEKAITNYRKALELAEIPTVNNELDLVPMVNYAMLETFTGNQEQAVYRLNKVLDIDWMTYNNKQYVETFRNEFEFYEGNGRKDLEPSRDLVFKTTNPDSIKALLKQNHINIAGTYSKGSDSTDVYVSQKFKSGLEKLNIKAYSNAE